MSTNELNTTERHTGRKWGVGILILLGVVLLFFANISFWTYFTLLNTNGWVAAMGPMSQDPDVAGLVSQYVVSDLFEQADIDDAVQAALPSEFQVFSGPLVAGLEQIADQVTSQLIMSDAFNSIWSAFNRVGHMAVMEVLKGQGNRLYFQDGNLTLDFSDLYNFIQEQLGLENLNLIPQAQDGRLVLFTNQTVAILQEAVAYLTTIGLLLPLLTIVIFAAAVWISLWRRQTVIWIGIVTAAVMFISLIVFSVVRSTTLVSIQDPFLRELARAIINVLTQGLMVQTIFFLIVGILLVIGGWQAAPDSALRTWEAARKTKQLAETEQFDAESMA